MRSTLFFIMILLIICGSCRKSSVKDYSLSQEEYQKLGIPDHNRVWTFEDYSKTFGALSKLKFNKPFALPAKDSKRSGELFNRMISFENMSFLQDESIPLNEKANWIKGFFEVHGKLIDIYTNIRMGKQYYNRELIDINIFGLSLAEKMLDLANQINESENVADVKMQSGYRSIQMIYMAGLEDVLENQKYTSQYLNEDLEILTDSLTNSVMRNKDWMDSAAANDLKQALLVVMDSTSSDYIRKKYIELTELL